MPLSRKGHTLAVLGCVIASALGMPLDALAQAVNSGVSLGPTQSLSKTAPLPTPPDSFTKPELLFGDWAGLRTNLEQLGINVLLDYTSETAGNVSGPARRNLACVGQQAPEINIDWQKLARITGFATHFVVPNRAGSRASEGFGDNLLPVQEIHGGGGNVLVHVVQPYGEETFSARSATSRPAIGRSEPNSRRRH